MLTFFLISLSSYLSCFVPVSFHVFGADLVKWIFFFSVSVWGWFNAGALPKLATGKRRISPILMTWKRERKKLTSGNNRARLTIWISDKPSIHVWLSNDMVFEWWSENQAKNVSFIVKNIWNSNGLPNHMIRHLIWKPDQKVSEKPNVWMSGVR